MCRQLEITFTALTRGCFNKKMPRHHCKNSNHKNTLVSWLLYVYHNKYSCTKQNILHIETGCTISSMYTFSQQLSKHSLSVDWYNWSEFESSNLKLALKFQAKILYILGKPRCTESKAAGNFSWKMHYFDKNETQNSQVRSHSQLYNIRAGTKKSLICKPS